LKIRNVLNNIVGQFVVQAHHPHKGHRFETLDFKVWACYYQLKGSKPWEKTKHNDPPSSKFGEKRKTIL
jgi:hypothetical protein